MSPRKKLADQQGGYSGTAVIYARYSSHNQREASIEQQVAECQKFADANNLHIAEVYADKAISGKTDRRPNFQRMMRDAGKGKFQYVVAWKSNRMGRNMLDAMMNDSRLRDMGVRCLYTEEDFDDTAAGRFALRNMMNVNQFYSENMAEDIMRGMMDNARKCMVNNGGLPLGYKKGEDGRYAIDEAGAAIVREIYERFYAGEAFIDIANDLNARGLKTSRGNRWNKGSFHRLLTNERYIGVYEFGGVRIEGGVPPIIRKELFYAVQEKLKTKKNAQGRHRENGDYLLTGKLFCGHCGSPMVGISGTSKTKDKHYYYICQKKRLEKNCKKKTVRRDWIEQKIAEITKEYLMRDEVIQWLVDGYDNFLKLHRKDSMLLAAEEEMEGVKKAIKNVMAAIEQGIITPTTKDRLMELEDDRRRLEATIAVERAALVDIPKDKIQFWLESFRAGDVTDKKYQAKLIDSFVQAIYLYDGEMRAAFNYCGKKNSVTVSLDEVDGLGGDASAESSYKIPSPPALLELLGPELLVLHLVDRQEHKVQGIFLKKGPEPGDGVDLHPKLQPGFQGDPVPVPLPQFPDGGMVLGIIHIGQELAVLPDHLLPGIPVHLNAVIHVVGEAELFQAQSDGVPRHLLHGISRVVAEGGVYMIVSQHAPSPLPGH